MFYSSMKDVLLIIYFCHYFLLIKANSSNNGLDPKFEVLISTVHTSFAEVYSATQDLLAFKDALLTHHLPSSVLNKLTCLFSRLYRSFSDLNLPVNELLRLVKLYSSSWEKQTQVMQRLYRESEQKRALLNVAIRRLAIADRRASGWEHERRVLNWERLFVRLTEARGHGKRWKFRIENVKRRVEEGGYENLVQRLRNEDMPSVESLDELKFEQDEMERMNRRQVDFMRARKKKKGRRENFEDVGNLSLDMRFENEEQNENKDEVYNFDSIHINLFLIKEISYIFYIRKFLK